MAHLACFTANQHDRTPPCRIVYLITSCLSSLVSSSFPPSTPNTRVSPHSQHPTLPHLPSRMAFVSLPSPLPPLLRHKSHPPCRSTQTPRNLPQMHATRPFTSRVASGALKLLIKSLCTTADNLHVDIDAVSNRAFLSGRLTAVSVTASRIVYNKFSISGGAALSTDEICLLPRSLPFPLLEKPFSVSVRATLTEADLDRPGPARDALQHLLRQIISTGLGGAVGRVLPSDIGGITCFLEGVELDATRETSRPGMFSWLTRPQDAGGKIVLHTRAVLADGRVYTFAVRTGLTTISDGNVVKFSDPELLWRNLAFPLLTIDMIGVKLSPTTKLTNIEIDKGTLSGDGIIVIPPPSDLSRTLSSKESNAAAKASKNTRLEARRISGRFGL